MSIPAAGGTPRPLAETSDGFGRYSELVGWSADGKKLYFTEAHGTSLRLLALPLRRAARGDQPRRRAWRPAACFSTPTRTHFGFAWETLDRPPEAFVSAVETRSSRVQVSRVNAICPRRRSAAPRSIRWKSTDGLEIEGLLTYPVGYEKGKRYPLLLVVHGGPMGVFTQTFTATAGLYPVAAFAARGYAVLRPNPRGSSGYGKKFRYANYGDWGGGDYQDLMAGVDHVIDLGVADAGPPGRDGLELRRLHDLVDDHADQALQGRLGRRRRDRT